MALLEAQACGPAGGRGCRGRRARRRGGRRDRHPGRAAPARRRSPPRSLPCWRDPDAPPGDGPAAQAHAVARARCGGRAGAPGGGARRAFAAEAGRRARVRVCLIRHASTSWNEAGRIQGRTDVPLSPMAAPRPPAGGCRPASAMRRCVTSPLGARARDRRLLGLPSAASDPRLGRDALGPSSRAARSPIFATEHGAALADLEAMGLDFRPPGGESPREVAARLAAFLADLARPGRDIWSRHPQGRAARRARPGARLGHAGRPPVRYDPERALLFELDSEGRPRPSSPRTACARRQLDRLALPFLGAEPPWAPAICAAR